MMEENSSLCAALWAKPCHKIRDMEWLQETWVGERHYPDLPSVLVLTTQAC